MLILTSLDVGMGTLFNYSITFDFDCVVINLHSSRMRDSLKLLSYLVARTIH